MVFCVEKSKEFVSFKCTCQAHELLLTTESLPITILLGELQQVNLPINDQNGGHLMQSLLIFIGTKVPNSKIMAYTKIPCYQCCVTVIRNGKVYSFNSKADYIVKDYLEKSAKTLAVGEIQSSPVSHMTAVGIMANELPKMLLEITMTKKLACNLYIVSSSGGYNYKTDLTGPITFEHLNTSIYQLNDPKSLKEFCKIVAHFFTVQKTADESELSLSEESSFSEDSQAKKPRKDF